MLPILSRFFDSNDREIKRVQPILDKIAEFEKEYKKLKDTQIPKKTEEFKKRIQDGEDIFSLLPEAFALVREASNRTLGMRHFDVQLIAAYVLAHGKISEQKTGEGKTMSAVPALYLHSLTGKGVHLVTVNDYLARRDAGWMGPIFHALGVSVSSIINDASYIYDPEFTNEASADPRLSHLRPVNRKEAYAADVTYGINSEFGFDYLRDNMAQSMENLSQRNYYFAIVDEVDSVLIDEARTPHIISAPDDEPSEKYYEYAKIVEKLSPDTDYKIDEKLKTAHLTDHGIGKIEKLFGVANIYEKDFDTVYHIEASLRARTLFHREKDYIVRDGEVILVDEFTGRLMPGRRLSDGLHQAIEAKEGVVIQRESKTLATVSLQNYFRMYERLAGMTGTAVTEAEEFNKIYKLDVVVIPTHNKIQRIDHPDSVYKTTRAKITAVVEEVITVHKTGQPVLVGTTSIEKNEIISELLKRRGIKHEVLNAKNHLKEAEIIAEAGKKNAVTVATNMAGRGVDIILGGDTPKQESLTEKEYKTALEKWQKAHDDVLKLGGLYVIGTERHESRRIDNQLRGRSGRQGDPGTSRFFVALDDEIMRLFGGDRIAGIMTRFNMPEDVPLTHSLVSRAIENAQVKVEGFNFDNRKHVVEYDDVLNKQREIIYALRRKILESSGQDGAPLRDEVLQRVKASIATFVQSITDTAGFEEGETPNEKIIAEFVRIIPLDAKLQQQLLTQLEQETGVLEKTELLSKVAEDIYNHREHHIGTEAMRYIERGVMLHVIDTLWMNHLDVIDNLRQGIGLRGYAQKDPLVEYKNEAYRMFEQLVFSIDEEIAHRIYNVDVQVVPQNTQPSDIVTNTPESEISEGSQKSKIAKGQNKKSSGAVTQQHTHDHVHVTLPTTSQIATTTVPEAPTKLGRNDPCWCGSGKKWKKCHYPQTS